MKNWIEPILVVFVILVLLLSLWMLIKHRKPIGPDSACIHCKKPIHWNLMAGWVHTDTGLTICNQTRAVLREKSNDPQH